MHPSISLHDLSKLDAPARKRLTQRTEADLSVYTERVRPIIEAVRTQGDVALSRYALELD